MDLALQPSIAGDLRSKAHLELTKRLKNLDLSTILVYRIASLVDSAVLPMAWQFDVLNPLLLPTVSQVLFQYAGTWDQVGSVDALASIDLLQFEGTVPETLSVLRAQYRALILLSTSLHSTLGTVGAIKNALSGLGYSGAIIQEGQSSWGGSSWPSNQGWAVFRVLINLAQVPPDTDFSLLSNRMTAVCNYWKPARCWLDSVQFFFNVVDIVQPPVTDRQISIFSLYDTLSPLPFDFIVAPAWPLSDIKTIAPDYDGAYNHAAGIKYGGTQPHVADGGVVINGVAISPYV